MAVDARIYVQGPRRDEEAWFDLVEGSSKEEIIAMSVAELAIHESEADEISYVLQEIDGYDLDVEVDADDLAKLSQSDHGTSPVLAALNLYSGLDQALILLDSGYTVWNDEGELVDAFLEPYDISDFLLPCFDDKKLLKLIKQDRTIVEVPTGALVEFHR